MSGAKPNRPLTEANLRELLRRSEEENAVIKSWATINIDEGNKVIAELRRVVKKMLACDVCGSCCDAKCRALITAATKEG